MKINIKNTKLLAASLSELDSLTNGRLTLTRKIQESLRALNPNCTNDDISQAQVYSNSLNPDISTEYITVNIDESLLSEAKAIIAKYYPNTKITNPFVIRIAINRYIFSLKKVPTPPVINHNQNIQWADSNNITYDPIIYTHGQEVSEIRAVYCITKISKDHEETCLYVGRSNSIYGRVFIGDCHIARMRNGTHIPSVQQAIQNKEHLHIKILELVPLLNDHPAKDAQRLASRENYWIDYYQNLNMCLEQYPEGRWN